MLIFSTLYLYISKSRYIKCLIFQKRPVVVPHFKGEKEKGKKRKRDRGSLLLALGFNSDISGLQFNQTTRFCAS